MTGKIVRIVADKGFGFIRSDVSKVDYFFHRTDFENGYEADFQDLISEFNAKSEISVEFNDVANNKGPRAANVRRVA